MSTISALSSLEDGFLGEGSVAPTQDVLAKLIAIGRDLEHRHVVPSWNGGLLIEWRDARCEFTAALEPSRQLFLCVDDTETDELREIERPFAETVLRQFLRDGTWSA